jgi:hypothetical protein
MKNSLFRQVLTETCDDEMSIQRGNKLIDQGNPERGNKILDKGNPNVPLNEESEQTYTVTFWVRQNDDKVDHDWDVKANSPEEAIEKVQSGSAKGPYGQDLPRLARNFSAKLKN